MTVLEVDGEAEPAARGTDIELDERALGFILLEVEDPEAPLRGNLGLGRGDLTLASLSDEIVRPALAPLPPRPLPRPVVPPRDLVEALALAEEAVGDVGRGVDVVADAEDEDAPRPRPLPFSLSAVEAEADTDEMGLMDDCGMEGDLVADVE